MLTPHQPRRSARSLRRSILGASFIVALSPACQPRASEPDSPESPAATETVTPAARPPIARASSASAEPSASAPPLATPAPRLAPVAKVVRDGKKWPFHAWNRAEALTFNAFEMRPGVPLVVVDDLLGWSPFVTAHQPLDLSKAQQAVDLVFRTEGGVLVSKCPFPRHAVVLYENEAPVASINICFSCGDILLWPAWAPEPAWDTLTPNQQRAIERRQERQLVLYDKTFPKWQTLFRDTIGWPIDVDYP